MLNQKIDSDIIEAMKSKDEETLSVLRMVKSAIKNKEIEKKTELEDVDVMGVIQSQIKTRRDSVEMYKTGGREELAQKEEKEISILQKYLPEQMSEVDVRVKVKEAITKTGASQISDMGKVMGMVVGELKGKADGSMISKIVKEELS
jgi:uncharacterized protein